MKLICNLTDAYLQHDGTDVPHTLSDGLWSARDCDSSFRRVWQHVSGHLNLSTGGLKIAIRRRKKTKKPTTKKRLFSAKNPTLLKPLLKCCFKQPQITPNTFWHAESSCKANRNVCSNILRGAHKYCPFRGHMHAVSAGLPGHNHWDCFSSSRENPRKHVLQEKINKRSLTGVFDTCCFTTPK